MLTRSSHNRVSCCSALAVRHRSAFTLVELLVVLAVIAILIALLLPAVQSAREAARVLECKNHLKQIGLAWQHHHEAWKFFPTGGWGSHWAGDPDQGFDKRQPGGWAYNSLPYLEERSIHDLGKGATYGGTPDKKDLLAQAAQSVSSIFLCPSRRQQTSLFVFTGQSTWFGNINLRNVANVWRGDYCANAGDQKITEQLATPTSVQTLIDMKFQFDKTDDPTQPGYSTGVSYYQSTVSIRQITDGTSHKYAVGEKFLYMDKYYTGDDLGDNDWLWTGWNNDLYRTAGVNYLSGATNFRTRSPIPPQRDMQSYQADATTQQYEANMWGSPHQSGFNMVYCDGSVHVLDYGIDLLLHRRMHNRFWGY
jgi:prepilin-type N-terminal cleavage/methylation domain-containing protein/prepilin-type processing-associated H-X9-DG protein